MHKKVKPNKWAKLGRDIMWIAVLIMALGIIMAIISALSGTAKASMTDCIDATCRITAADGGVGSGCVFEISRGGCMCSPRRTWQGKIARFAASFGGRDTNRSRWPGR